MSFLNVQWIHEYDTLKEKIKAKRIQGNLLTGSELNELNGVLDSLTRNLASLQASLMEHEISSSEISRRQIILENLRKQMRMIPQSSESLANRESFGIDPTRNSSNISSANNSRKSETIFNPIASNTSQQALVQRQQEIMKQQDAMLVDIGKGVDVLHNQALEINQEAKVHINIINKLDINVDKASEALKTEAEHAESIKQASRMCYMYIVLVVELVIIVLMVIFLFALK